MTDKTPLIPNDATSSAHQEEGPKPPLARFESTAVHPEVHSLHGTNSRVELHLLYSQQPNQPGGEYKPAPVKTDAEYRVFFEDALIKRTQADFARFNLTDQELRPLAEQVVDSIRLELELVIEASRTSDRPLISAEEFRRRTWLLGFRFQKFLDTIKHVDEKDFRAAEEKLRATKTAAQVDLLKTGEYDDLEDRPADQPPAKELPQDIVAHMLEVGFDAHLELVKKVVWGEREPLGITVTYREVVVSHDARVVQVEDKNQHHSFLSRVCRPHRGGPQTVGTAVTKLFLSPFLVAQTAVKKARSSSQNDLLAARHLKGVSGVLRSGSITLLLGPPKAGKTHLLQALAGRIKAKGAVHVTGDVWYNGHNQRDVYAPNFCVMVGQTDVHIPVLTVRETLEFAYACRGRPQHKVSNMSLNPDQLRRAAKARVDLVMSTLGLARVADTVIGNDVIKGVSGGEMRRVTLAEMLVVGSKVMFLDEISTGLDSAATLDITKALRSLCRVYQCTSVISLLQPPPETVALFDQIILMVDGRIAYHGPRGLVEGFMTSAGFPRPVNDHRDLADFLVDTLIEGDPIQFEARFKETEAWQLMDDILQKDPTTLQHPDDPREALLIESRLFKRSFQSLVRIVAARQMTILLRNRAFIIARLIQNVMMGLILGLVFYQVPFTNYYLIAMVLSQILAFMGFSSVALIADIIGVRNVFYKQNREAFFPATVYVIADWIVMLPFSVFDALCLGTISYFMVGLSITNHGRPYFVYLCIVIAFAVCMAQAVRFFAYVSSARDAAYGITVLYAVVSLVFSGAIVTPGLIPPWWIWIYWGISSNAWAYRSLMQNEFLSDKYQAMCETGCPNNLQGQCVSYCSNPPCAPPYPNMLCGDLLLNARQVPTDSVYIWWGFGMVIMFTTVFAFLSILALKFLHHDEDQSVIDYVDYGKSTDEDKRAAVEATQGATMGADAGATSRGAGVQFQTLGAMAGEGLGSTTNEGKREDIPKHPDVEEGVKSTNSQPEPQPIGDGRGSLAPTRHMERRSELTPNELSEGFTPSALVFKDIRYTISVPIKDGGEHRRSNETMQVDLLKGVSGFALPYEMTALMGSSGAGKTTLLDVLSFRKTVGRVSGTFEFGKQPYYKERRVPLGYVEQFGSHLAKSTIREAIEFSARLRLPEKLQKHQDKIVHGVLKMLEMESMSSSMCGSLSFEEMKRITIAVELVAVPELMFADEPTSGLTSHEANLTMRALKRVAATGRPVICTIHQPSQEVFSMFDRLLLLKRGGQVVFFGELGRDAQNLVNYFEGIPGVDPITPNANPANWMLDVIGAGVGRRTQDFDYAEVYELSALKRSNDEKMNALLSHEAATGNESHADVDVMLREEEGMVSEVARLVNDRRLLGFDAGGGGGGGSGARGSEANGQLFNQQDYDEKRVPKVFAPSKWLDSPYSVSYGVQFRVLMHRAFLEVWRTPSYSLMRWFVLMFFAFLIGSTYYQGSLSTAAGVQSRVGVINMMLILASNYNSSTIIPFLVSHRAVFYREKASVMYSPLLFAVVSQLVEDPFIFVEVVLVLIPFYWLVGMAATAKSFFAFFFLYLFYVELATWIGGFFAAIMPSAGPASLATTLLVQLVVLFNGIAAPGGMLPTWLLFAYYCSPARWAMEGLVATQFNEYTNVACIPFGTPLTWTNDTLVPPLCPGGVNASGPAQYLSDVNVWARCCEPPTACPMSARSYVYYGSDKCGVPIQAFLGGPTGYQAGWLGFDYLFVILYGMLLRFTAALLTAYVSHQRR